MSEAIIETLAVIPARMASTRLPGKPLIKLAGRELILRVLDGVRGASLVDRIIVATDDERIASVVRSEGGEAMMTPGDLATGGDRVAFVARGIESRFVLNVQGDDSMVSGLMIDRMIDTLKNNNGASLAVLVKKIEKPDEITRDSVVKVIFDQNHRALYFSRSPIPFVRDSGTSADIFKHVGPYAWRREMLFEFASWEQTPLERAESLEQLRVLEHGRAILCIPTEIDSVWIDTPGDIERFSEIYEGRR